MNNTMELYFSVGIPANYTYIVNNPMLFEPKLISLSTNTGSIAGSKIIAVVKGVGVNDKITLYDEANDRDICQTATVIDYGQLECLTIPEEFTTAIQLSVKELESGIVHACAASSTASCEYQTYDSASQMSVSEVTLTSETQLTFTVSNLPADPCEAIFFGGVSDSCTVSSNTSVIATFNMGLPTTSEAIFP